MTRPWLDLHAPDARASLYLRAVGKRKITGVSLPAQGLRCYARVQPQNLAAYRNLCHFPDDGRLPATYPHVMAFDLQLQLLTRADFPFPLLGLVHLHNGIEVYRPLGGVDGLHVQVWAENLQPHAKGGTFDLISEARDGLGLLWRETSRMLVRGLKLDAPAREAAEQDPVPPTSTSGLDATAMPPVSESTSAPPATAFDTPVASATALHDGTAASKAAPTDAVAAPMAIESQGSAVGVGVGNELDGFASASAVELDATAAPPVEEPADIAAMAVTGPAGTDDPTRLTEATRWYADSDIGRRYAKVAGDYNPIHLSALSARLFGFPSAIAHGMWNQAMALAALRTHLPEAGYRFEVDFHKPVRLPAEVVLSASPAGPCGTLRLEGKEQRLHMSGRWTAL